MCTWMGADSSHTSERNTGSEVVRKYCLIPRSLLLLSQGFDGRNSVVALAPHSIKWDSGLCFPNSFIEFFLGNSSLTSIFQEK